MSKINQYLSLGGRILLYITLWYVVKGLAQLIVSSKISIFPSVGWVVDIFQVAAVVAFTYVLRRYVDKRPWAGMAIPVPSKKCFREWLGNISLTSTAGILIGAAMMSIIFIFEYFIGWVHIVGIESNDIHFLLCSATTYLVTGITEEIMMRGYIFQNIGEEFPIWAATLTNGIIFGILHFNSPGFVWMFIVGAVIITLFLVITRLTSGAIWFAIGWHVSWDLGQTSLFGLSEVGKPDFGHAFLHVTQNGPTIFVGIAPSIESGFLIISITLLASAILIFFVRQIGHLIAWKSKLDSNGAPIYRGVLQ